MQTKSRLAEEARIAVMILLRGYPGLFFKEIKRRLHSEDTYFGLRRDLSVPFDSPEAKVPIDIRPLRKNDLSIIFGSSGRGLTAHELKDHMRRNLLLRANIPTCYAAVIHDDTPCYIQWLIGPEHNEQIQKHFKGGFPPLGPDEALLEGAYTPPAYRGLGIMSRAMSMIAEKAVEFGARRAITFVCYDNISALKGCRSAGFVPFTIRTSRWRSFKRTLNFTPLSSVPGNNVVTLPKIFKSGP
ncbi:MAG: GNAT family N-acetyltransferase [Syntrophales bacterium]